MWQVLWRIPITNDGIPIYGFGMMLFLAFIACTWLASRRAEREGIAKETVQDLAIWIFIGGLLGARITYLLNEQGFPNSWRAAWAFITKLPLIWEGGIVLYGSILGGVASYFLAWGLIYRKQHLSTLRFVDAIAPSIAVGLALGRLGCFLNGCCYGQVACTDCAVVATAHFPLSAPCREMLVYSGDQTVAGFTTIPEPAGAREGVRVGAVDPGSQAYHAGLRPGSIITGVNGVAIHNRDTLDRTLGSLASWPRGQTWLELEFQPSPGDDPITQTIYPRTLGLYPTQVYETISMTLLLLVLLAYYPYRRQPGQVCAILMVGYGIHRYLNEILRDDPRPIGLEAYGSIILVIAGVLMWAALSLRKRTLEPLVTMAVPSEPAAVGETRVVPGPGQGIVRPG
jgi:prolipoprotein diacylglyceryltransferase